MFDDFCSDCQFRQNPAPMPMGQGGFGTQMPMQGPMTMPSMMGPGGMGAMQGPMTTPSMQGPMMPGMQAPGNIFQGPSAPLATGMPSPTTGILPQAPVTIGGQPTGPSLIPGATFVEAPGSPVFLDTRYIQGYLRTLVGRFVRVEFLIGTSQLRDREGTLLNVGVSYIVLREAETDDNVMCDLFTIKFVTVFL
ncbi:MAG: hypothetical protein Q8930_19220 [Bacillota bacterium]|nr:hypothetical protein [Bacillota bacterium]